MCCLLSRDFRKTIYLSYRKDSLNLPFCEEKEFVWTFICCSLRLQMEKFSKDFNNINFEMERVKAQQNTFSDIIEDYCSSHGADKKAGSNYLGRLKQECDILMLQKCKIINLCRIADIRRKRAHWFSGLKQYAYLWWKSVFKKED